MKKRKAGKVNQQTDIDRLYEQCRKARLGDFFYKFYTKANDCIGEIQSIVDDQRLSRKEKKPILEMKGLSLFEAEIKHAEELEEIRTNQLKLYFYETGFPLRKLYDQHMQFLNHVSLMTTIFTYKNKCVGVMKEDEILPKLKNIKTLDGNQYLASCPCHDDTESKLAIKIVIDDVFLHCFSGCNNSDILKKLELPNRFTN